MSQCFTLATNTAGDPGYYLLPVTCTSTMTSSTQLVIQTESEFSANTNPLAGITMAESNQLISSVVGLLVTAALFKYLENFILGKKI